MTEFAASFMKEKVARFTSHRGGKEYDVPQIKAWGEKHRSMLPLDGEIYNHQELTFQQICSAVKCCSAMTDKLRMVIYDAQIPGSFSARWKVLQEEFASIESKWTGVPYADFRCPFREGHQAMAQDICFHRLRGCYYQKCRWNLYRRAEAMTL